MLLLYMEKLSINVWLFVFFLHVKKDHKQYIYVIIIYEHVKEFWKDVFDTHDAIAIEFLVHFNCVDAWHTWINLQILLLWFKLPAYKSIYQFYH